MLLPCPKCKKQVEIVLSESGPHIKASCIECGAYIKFMPLSELEGKKMSEFEISFPIEGSQYNERILINKYGDQYSLVLGREGQSNGTVYMQWGHPSDKDKNPRPKAIPWKIPLGNYVQARQMLTALLSVFAKPEQQQQPAQKPTKDEDIPF